MATTLVPTSLRNAAIVRLRITTQAIRAAAIRNRAPTMLRNRALIQRRVRIQRLIAVTPPRAAAAPAVADIAAEALAAAVPLRATVLVVAADRAAAVAPATAVAVLHTVTTNFLIGGRGLAQEESLTSAKHIWPTPEVLGRGPFLFARMVVQCTRCNSLSGRVFYKVTLACPGDYSILETGKCPRRHAAIDGASLK